MREAGSARVRVYHGGVERRDDAIREERVSPIPAEEGAWNDPSPSSVPPSYPPFDFLSLSFFTPDPTPLARRPRAVYRRTLWYIRVHAALRRLPPLPRCALSPARRHPIVPRHHHSYNSAVQTP